MNEAKHTPGPWFISHHRYVMANEKEGGYDVEIGRLNQWKDAPEEAEANARLVAAAPELLEACIQQHEAIDMLWAELISCKSDFLPTKHPTWEAALKGKAAIAKAAGDQN